MNHATTLAKQTAGEAPRLSPLEAFVAWLATFLRTIAGLKRRTVFPPNWKDHWQGLRELEWYRDQILAFSAKHVLAGGSLDDRTDFQLITGCPGRLRRLSAHTPGHEPSLHRHGAVPARPGQVHPAPHPAHRETRRHRSSTTPCGETPSVTRRRRRAPPPPAAPVEARRAATGASCLPQSPRDWWGEEWSAQRTDWSSGPIRTTNARSDSEGQHARSSRA